MTPMTSSASTDVPAPHAATHPLLRQRPRAGLRRHPAGRRGSRRGRHGGRRPRRLLARSSTTASTRCPRPGPSRRRATTSCWPSTAESVCRVAASPAPSTTCATSSRRSRRRRDLPKPLVLVGHSAGGHLVTWAAGQPWARERGIAGVVSLAGVVDLGAADRLHLGLRRDARLRRVGTGHRGLDVRRPDVDAAAEGAGAARQRRRRRHRAAGRRRRLRDQGQGCRRRRDRASSSRAPTTSRSSTRRRPPSATSSPPSAPSSHPFEVNPPP